MCWYSAEHAGQTLKAEAGQRLVIRKVHGSSWAVQESDLEKSRPTPVCLVDQTRVLFRFRAPEQTLSTVRGEAEAVFRMLNKPKRDVFQFSDGNEIEANNLPSDLVFDVLEIPGKEHLSAFLKGDSEQGQKLNPGTKRESLLDRVAALF